MSTAAPTTPAPAITTPASLAPLADDQLMATLANDHNIQNIDAQAIRAAFAPFVIEARRLVEASRAVVVTSAEQKDQIKRSADLHKQLQKVRTSADKARKELKENSLRMGKAIDGAFNILLAGISPEETRLLNQAKFVEREAEARRQALIVQRHGELLKVGGDPVKYDLGSMAEAVFQQLLETCREAQRQAEEKAAAEKAAREAEDAARRDRERELEEENQRLARELEQARAAVPTDLTQSEIAAHQTARHAGDFQITAVSPNLKRAMGDVAMMMANQARDKDGAHPDSYRQEPDDVLVLGLVMASHCEATDESFTPAVDARQAEVIRRLTIMRDALTSIAERWNGRDNQTAMLDALEFIQQTADDAVAAVDGGAQ